MSCECCPSELSGYLNFNDLPWGDVQGDWVSVTLDPYDYESFPGITVASAGGYAVRADGTLWAFKNYAARAARVYRGIYDTEEFQNHGNVYYENGGSQVDPTQGYSKGIFVQVGYDNDWATVNGNLLLKKNGSLWSIGNVGNGVDGTGVYGEKDVEGFTSDCYAVISSPVRSVTLVTDYYRYPQIGIAEFSSSPSLYITAVENGVESSPSGSGASLVAEWAGRVVSISVTDGGEGYKSPPKVRVVPSCEEDEGKSAVAAVTEMIGGRVSKIEMLENPAVWTQNPDIVIDGAATAEVTSLLGPVKSVSVTSGGSGYTTSHVEYNWGVSPPTYNPLYGGGRQRVLCATAGGGNIIGIVELSGGPVVSVSGPSNLGSKYFQNDTNGRAAIFFPKIGSTAAYATADKNGFTLVSGGDSYRSEPPPWILTGSRAIPVLVNNSRQWVSIDGSQEYSKQAVDSEGNLWWWGRVRGNYVSFCMVPERVGQGVAVDVGFDCEVGVSAFDATPAGVAPDTITISGITVSAPDFGQVSAVPPPFVGRLKSGSLSAPYSDTKWSFFRANWGYSQFAGTLWYGNSSGVGYTTTPTVTVPSKLSSAGITATARLVGPSVFTSVHRGLARDTSGKWYSILPDGGYGNSYMPRTFSTLPDVVEDLFTTTYTSRLSYSPTSISRTYNSSFRIRRKQTYFSKSSSRQYGSFTVTRKANVIAKKTSFVSKTLATKKVAKLGTPVMQAGLYGFSVVSVPVTDGGENYITAPTVVFSGSLASGFYLQASGAAVLSGGKVVSITINSGGGFYSSAATVSLLESNTADTTLGSVVDTITFSDSVSSEGEVTGTCTGTCDETFPEGFIEDDYNGFLGGVGQFGNIYNGGFYTYDRNPYSVSPGYSSKLWIWSIYLNYSSGDKYKKDPYLTYDSDPPVFKYLQTTALSVSPSGGDPQESDYYESEDLVPFVPVSPPGMDHASGRDVFISSSGYVTTGAGYRNEIAKPLVSIDASFARDSNGSMWYGFTNPILWYEERKAMKSVEATLTSTGGGYTQFPLARISQPVGVASLKADDVIGRVAAIGVIDGGSGYRSPPYIAIGGFNTSATAVIEGPVDSVSIKSGGSGYRIAPKVVFSKPGIPAKATATINQDGTVAGVVLSSGGKYRSAPSVTLIAQRDLDTITITNRGDGFTSAPKVLVVGGGGTGAKATAKVEDGKVVSVQITKRGSGYEFAPKVLFVGGGGTGAAAVATVEAVGSGGEAEATIDGSIIYVRVDERFTESVSIRQNPPEVTVSGNARLQASIEYSAGSVTVESPGDYYSSSPAYLGIATDKNGFNRPKGVAPSTYTATTLSATSRRGSGISSVAMPTPAVWSDRVPSVSMVDGSTVGLLMCMRLRDVSLSFGTQSYPAGAVSRPNGNLSAYPFFVGAKGQIKSVSGSSFTYSRYLYSLAPAITVNDVTGSSAYVVVSDIGEVQVITPGSNYSLAAYATASGGRLKCWDNPATAIAVAQFGKVVSINIVNEGDGYLRAPEVFISGGGGTGAKAVAIASYFGVFEVVVTHQGSGYTSTPTVTFVETHTLEDAAAYFDKYAVRSVELQSPDPEYCRLIGPAQQQTFGYGGAAYAFGSPGVPGCTFVNHYTDGFVEAIGVSQPKLPYTYNPEITIDPPLLSDGQRARATASRITWTNTYSDGFPVRQT